jgi:hypothetical protein
MVMRAEVISISSIPRQNVHNWEREAMLAGFTKALGILDSLRPATWKEAQTAMENWMRSEKLNEAERDALFQYFGWERS